MWRWGTLGFGLGVGFVDRYFVSRVGDLVLRTWICMSESRKGLVLDYQDGRWINVALVVFFDSLEKSVGDVGSEILVGVAVGIWANKKQDRMIR